MEIPDGLKINWDQTGINYVPVSELTMMKERSKCVEVVGLKDIIAVFSGSMSGDFLPIQLVCQGKITKCLSTIDFPEQWHLAYTKSLV